MSTRILLLTLALALAACSDTEDNGTTAPDAGSDTGQDVRDVGEDAGEDTAEDTADTGDTPDVADAPDTPDLGEPDARDGIEQVTEWTGPCSADSREVRMVDLGSVKLHTTCSGSGETLLFLHGFPEWWYGWNDVVGLLPDYRTVAPDQRGYNLSDKPADEADYHIDHLVADVVALIDALGGPVVLVGHDWGGIVSWAVAARHPEKLRGLVIVNAPHPNIFLDLYDNDDAQREAVGYFNLLITPGSEVGLAANDFAFLISTFGDVLSAEEAALYKEAWGRDKALLSMVNYYRANLDDDGRPNFQGEYMIDVPTLVIWGLADTALLASNLEGLDAYVPDLEVVTFENGTHWVAHEEPEGVSNAIRAFTQGLDE